MGSPGCEPTGCTPHSPLYISHQHTHPREGWVDETEDIKPPRSLLGLPELSWPGVYRPYYDRLVMEENPSVPGVTVTPVPLAPSHRTQDSRPPVLSPAQESPSVVEGQAEERCLEQVQTMVVGEVMKDVDTACKLLNIAAGKRHFSHRYLDLNRLSCVTGVTVFVCLSAVTLADTHRDTSHT